MIADSACIIGLGLIGGSIARDLAALGMPIAGYDADPVTLSAALDSEIVATPIEPDLRSALSHELVMVATPVRQIPDILLQLSTQSGRARLITDAGSTKQSILQAAEAAGLGTRFIGSHPLTGDHRSGWAAGRRGLFQGATAFLCPASGSAAGVLTLAIQLWEGIGAQPQIMSAAEHDARVSWISHLPQVLSSSLATVLRTQGFSRSDLGRGGRDMTRLAASDPRIWADILLTNRAELERALADATSQLADLRKALLQEDENAVLRFLQNGAGFDSTTDHP